jgi:hypothetical protein
MAQAEMLDDDAGFQHGAAIVHQHRKALERPQQRQLGRGLRVAQHAQLEWDRVLVERDQYLLAIRGEWMRIELEGHDRFLARRGY